MCIRYRNWLHLDLFQSLGPSKESVLNCESFCDLLCPQISVIGNCFIPAAKGEVPEIEPDHAVWKRIVCSEGAVRHWFTRHVDIAAAPHRIPQQCVSVVLSVLQMTSLILGSCSPNWGLKMPNRSTTWSIGFAKRSVLALGMEETNDTSNSLG